MKIGAISDTHGDFRAIREALKRLDDIDLLLHAGDFYEDAQRIQESLDIRVVSVVGNCDYMVRGPAEEMMAVGGRRIYLTHGHLYQVKKNLVLLVERAKSLGAHCVVFGHTHVPLVSHVDGLLLVNPGSPSTPRSGTKRACAVLDVAQGSLKAKTIYLDEDN
ncbi:MAG TPA: metallophosphoesterase [Firmicutes bacterium]|nr:metallophosphoesterase [Candidatus Fermentithermobacillaceae bacterium]